MKALVKTEAGPKRLEVRELPQPAPGPDEVLLRISECGICGTDLSLYHGGLAVDDDAGPRLPIVIGHEFTGMVVAHGADVSSLAEGDWVVVSPHLFCGRCTYCVRGEQEICNDRPLLSWDLPGGAAEYVTVRASNAYRLAKEVAVTVGALAEPLAVAVHALRRVAPTRDERVVIVGSGPIGILLGFVAVQAGHDVTLLGLELDNTRLAAARQLGVPTAVIEDAQSGPLAGEVDLVFEAAGTEQALAEALSLVRKGGRIGVLGLPHHPVPVDVAELVFAEKSLIGIRGYAPRDWHRTVELLTAHAAELAELITHDFELGEVAKAMEAVEGRQAIKVVLRPGNAWHTSNVGSK